MAEQSAGTQEVYIDVSAYTPGIYYCNLRINGQTRALPLLIQR